VLAPGEIRLVGTGLLMELPEGVECQVRPRSGLALKHGITLPNSPGTIDPDYRGEVKIIMQNSGTKSVTPAAMTSRFFSSFSFGSAVGEDG